MSCDKSWSNAIVGTRGFAGLLALGLVACVAEPTPEMLRLEHVWTHIDDTRPMADLERYVDFGHRHYGAPQRARAIEMMIRDFEPHVQTVERQDFEVREPQTGESFGLTNLIARTPPRPRRLLLGTHWDTRLWAEEESDPGRQNLPIPGANDGTSGVVVLLELARALDAAGGLERLGLDIVLFDGEEFGRPGSDDYVQGAKYFTQHLDRFYPGDPPVAVVVVDMVCDRELAFRRETHAERHARWLNDLVWSLGGSRFPEVFLDEPGPPVVDDHLPFLELGIPSTLLIDLEYPQWHTLDDTPEQCSAESLELVTRHLVELVLAFDGQDVPGAVSPKSIDPTQEIP